MGKLAYESRAVLDRGVASLGSKVGAVRLGALVGLTSALLYGCGESSKSKPTATGASAGADASAGTLNEGGAGLASGGSASSGSSSGGNSGTAGSTSGAGSIEEYPTQYGEAICSLLDRCWESFGAQLPADQPCQTLFERQLREGGFSNIIAAVADGRLEYHADSAQQCLELVASASCEQGLLLEPGDCAEIVTGSLETGDACTLDAECTGGQQCVVSDACPGACGPRAKDGEACTSKNRCEVGLICMVDYTNQGFCRPPGAPGATCDAGTPCGTFAYCAGLDRSEPESTGTCEPRDNQNTGKLGDPCGSVDGLCELDLVCALDGELAEIAGSCAEHVGSGAACAYAIPDMCPEGQYCQIGDTETRPLMGTCSPLPKLGELCAYGEVLAAPCSSEQYCSPTTKNCEQRLHLGEACTEHPACFSGRCVEAACVALLECEPDPLAP